jgi:hypothetical protein
LVAAVGSLSKKKLQAPKGKGSRPIFENPKKKNLRESRGPKIHPAYPKRKALTLSSCYKKVEIAKKPHSVLPSCPCVN